MDKKSSLELPVDLDAARLALEWKTLFAAELRTAAEHLATGEESVTINHYERALASAFAGVLRAANTNLSESADVCRRVA